MPDILTLVEPSDLPPLRSRLEAALSEYVADKPAGPVPRSVWLGDGYIELFLFNEAVHLAAVFVDPALRHQGHGSRYLRELLEIADKHQVPVECTVKPFGAQEPRTKMGTRDLKAWYKRHGFVQVPKRQTLRRAPQPVVPSGRST